MSENAQRVGILIIALTFLVTTVGIGLYAILFDGSNGSDELSQQEIQELIDQQTQEDFVAITCTTDESLSYTPAPPLQDKPLPNYTPQAGVADITCVDIAVGDGAEAGPTATVTAHYTGALAANGNVFQSSLDGGEPFTSPLSGLIQGWQEGIPGMKEGGKRRLFIPSELAYGESGTSGIPPNSDLVFDIELIEVTQ